MTTIAFDGKTLAADGRLTENGRILSWNDKKIFRIGDKLVGIAGDAGNVEKLLQWLMNECAGKKPSCKETMLMIVYPDGTVKTSDDGDTPVQIAVPCAIGSGKMHAETAMDMGLDAEHAVKMAMKRDSCTGGEITVLQLKDKNKA